MKPLSRCTVHSPGRLILLISSCALLSSCGGMVMRTRIDELSNPDIVPSRFQVLAVLPMAPEGFDRQVAGRAHEALRKQGITLAPARLSVQESESGMIQLCPKDQPPAYQGVLFVTWDRIILRDCETHFVAFRAAGGYAGVDAMVKRLVLYLRSSAAPK